MTSSPTAQIDPAEPRRGQPTDPTLLGALADPSLYGVASVEVHETHASWVFVAGEHAYKVKKPVDLGFLDYGTLPLRLAACREEVRVNRELAPDIYLGVRAILRTATGFALAPEHAPGALEYAVEMRTFREADTLAGLIASGSLTPAHLRSVARRLAAFHRSAAAVPGGRVADVLGMWQQNIRELAQVSHQLGWQLDPARAFAEAFARAHAGEIERRRRAGCVRDGHGDLRCEHVLAVPLVRVVDRVEFDPALRRTDVACDLAFLAMDLEACAEPWAARELTSAYREEGMDPGGEELQAFYAAHRALVRAKVALIAAAGGAPERAAAQLAQARALWEFAELLCWRARAPVALVICGPSASGKSTLAAELARRSGLPLISSDSVRKSAAGLAASERAAPEHYSEQFTRLTYALLAEEARSALQRERGVIVDATCRTREDRLLLAQGLSHPGLRSLTVHCTVPLGLALERAARRMRDAGRVSDATPEIVAEQHRSFEELDELDPATLLELDAARPLDAQVAAVSGAVDRLLARGARDDSREGRLPAPADDPAREARPREARPR